MLTCVSVSTQAEDWEPGHLFIDSNALHTAAMRGNAEVVRIILARGGDSTIKAACIDC